MLQATIWLEKYGPQELAALCSSIASNPFSPILTEEVGSLHTIRDCALCLLDEEGCIAAWYPGAEELYGYASAEVIGRHVSLLYGVKDSNGRSVADVELARVRDERHAGSETWQTRKNGSRFWANSITMALRDEDGYLRGFARAVRDFSERHERDEKLRHSRDAEKQLPKASQDVGTIYGKPGQLPEVNDAFLELVGYKREDIGSGQLQWQELTPEEFSSFDDIAHEEALRFGVSVPYEKELIRKNGDRVRVLVATAVLRLCPFESISFIRQVGVPEPPEEEEEDAAPTKPGDFAEIVGASPPLRRMEREIEMVSPTDTTVLVLGETGTGKELVARAIHMRSGRRNMPFVTLNCAAIPTGLLESELFGYERGAFTGALQQKIGRFEMAHRGTLFLDEVGDIPIDLQPKLLRALQEKSFERLGGKKTIMIDVRLVAATNRNLTQMMGDKLFRSDLYYRLRVFPITTPALRDRPGDIPLLARFFMKKYGGKMGKDIETIPAETMAAMVAWQWPGNVRELENFIERSVILSRGPALRAPLQEIRGETPQPGGNTTLEQVEREHIIRTFRECNGVVTATATRLGLHRTTLNAMMRKLGITRKDLLT